MSTLSYDINLKLFLLFICCASVYVHSTFVTSSPNINTNYITYQGNGSVSLTDIVLSLGQPTTDTLVYWIDAQDVQYGFTTSIVYSTSECDSIMWYGGGDGFAFVFSADKNVNLAEPRSTGGSLGLMNKTNIAMVGFDVLTDNIVYKATVGGGILGPRSGYNTTPAIVSGWRCAAGEFYVQVEYSPPTFHITSNYTNLNVSFTMDLRDYFDPYSQMYVGLSGATGEAYMKQTVTYWQFTGVPPPPDVIPILECYEQLDNGTFVAHMGYRNPTRNGLDYAIGPTNGFNPAPQNVVNLSPSPPADLVSTHNVMSSVLLVTLHTAYYPLNSFSFQWDGSNVAWNLTSYFVTFNGANTALLCPKSLNLAVVFTTTQNLTNAQINTILQSIANFLGISSSRVSVKNITYVPLLPVSKRLITQNGLEGTLELEIGDAGSQTQNEPSAAESVQKFVSSASNSTLVEEVLNPPGTETTINFVSLTQKPTGVEGTGSLIADVSVEPVTPPTTPESAPVSVPIVLARSTANERSVMWMSLVSATAFFSLF